MVDGTKRDNSISSSRTAAATTAAAAAAAAEAEAAAVRATLPAIGETAAIHVPEMAGGGRTATAASGMAALKQLSSSGASVLLAPHP